MFNYEPYVWKNDFSELLAKDPLKSIAQEEFDRIIELLRKEKSSDCIEFLLNDNKMLVEEFQSQEEIISSKYKGNMIDNNRNRIQFIGNALKNIKDLDINQKDYSLKECCERRNALINQISQNEDLMQFLKFLVHLTSIDKRFIQCGSNSLNILIEMKFDLKYQNFEDIRIQNTSLRGGNFFRCNLSGSEFDNVDISGINLNDAQLFDCRRINLKFNELNILNGHSSTINSISYSPNGSTLASGSNDSSIILWDVQTVQQKFKLDGHRALICQLSFSPDGKHQHQLVVIRLQFFGMFGLEKKSLIQWSYQSCKVCLLLPLCDDCSIIFWDIKTRKQIDKIIKTAAETICFSPDGSILASGDEYNFTRLWNVQTRKLKAHIICGARQILFSPDGKILAIRTGSPTCPIFLWDLEKVYKKVKLTGITASYSICFSPDGTMLAAGFRDTSIIIWDIELGQQKLKLKGHSYGILSICFSPDSKTLASGSNDLRLWNILTEKQKSQQHQHIHYFSSVCFSPTLASGSQDESIYLWDIKRGKLKAKLEGHQRAVNSVCFSPDGTTIAANSDKSITLWDVKTCQKKALLVGHMFLVKYVCFSSDGSTLVSCDMDASVILWNVQTYEIKSRLKGHEQCVDSVCYSPDGMKLALGSSDSCVIIWDIQSEQQLAKFEYQCQHVKSLCFSPDNTLLASNLESYICLRDIKSGKQLFKLDGINHKIYSVSFSPDGTTLASGNSDKSIILWDVQTGQMKAQLDGHRDCVLSVCYSPDGVLLASVSIDNSIRLWDVQSSKSLNEDLLNKNSQKIIFPKQELTFNKLNPVNITMQLIPHSTLLEANGALIFQGEFKSLYAQNLLSFFKSKGGVILEEIQM